MYHHNEPKKKESSIVNRQPASFDLITSETHIT
jgi:hypothetical protein